MKFFNWLVMSSENPEEASMTIRGILVLALPTLVAFLKDAGVNIAEGDIAHYVIIATAVLGALLTVVGVARKLYNTYADKKVVTFTAKKAAKKTKK